MAQIEKDGKFYQICLSDSNSLLLSYMELGDTLDFFGLEDVFLDSSVNARPTLLQDKDYSYMFRCKTLDLDDCRMFLWSMMDLTDEMQQHRQFVLGAYSL